MPQLAELAYFTDNVSRMTAFYEHLLGTQPVARSDDMAIFMAGGAKVFIHKTYTAGPGDLPPENHVAVERAGCGRRLPGPGGAGPHAGGGAQGLLLGKVSLFAGPGWAFARVE